MAIASREKAMNLADDASAVQETLLPEHMGALTYKSTWSMDHPAAPERRDSIQVCLDMI